MIYLILLFLTPALVIFSWFRDGRMYVGGEQSVVFYNIGKMLDLSSSIWINYMTGVSSVFNLTRIVFFHLIKYLDFIGTPGFLMQALTFYLLMLGGMLGVYFLAKTLFSELTKAKLVAFLAAVFYLLNPYSLSQVWTRSVYDQYFAFAFLPWVVLFVVLSIKSKNALYMYYLALCSVVFSYAYGWPSFILVYWITLSLTFLVVTIIYRSYWQSFRLYLIHLLAWTFINSFWLLPMLFGGTAGKIDEFAQNTEKNIGNLHAVSKYAPYPTIIRLLQNHYFFDAKSFGEIYSGKIFQLISWFYPLILIWFFKYRKKISLFLLPLSLLLLGLFISLGYNIPSRFVMVWLFENFTIFQAFRNSYEKFGLVYMLGYSLLFPLGALWVSEKLSSLIKITIPYKRGIFLGIIFFLISGVYVWPMWTGDITGDDKINRLYIPSYYQQLNQSIEGTEDYRIVAAPFLSGEGVRLDWQGYIYGGIDPLPFLVKPSVLSYAITYPYLYDIAYAFKSNIGKGNPASFLNLMGAKYLLVRGDLAGVDANTLVQPEFFTKYYFKPSNAVTENICDGEPQLTQVGTSYLRILCILSPDYQNLSSYKFLTIEVEGDDNGYYQVYLYDKNEARLGWNGGVKNSLNDTHQPMLLSLISPDDNNANFKNDQVRAIEIQSYSNKAGDLPSPFKVLKLELNQGDEKALDEFDLVMESGKLKLYKLKDSNILPPVGAVKKVIVTEDVPQILNFYETNHFDRSSVAFVAKSQNSDKSYEVLNKDYNNENVEIKKISSSKYWIKKNKDADIYLLFNQNYDLGWNIMPGVTLPQLTDNPLSAFTLFKSTTLPEDNHFVANGYANVWAIDEDEAEFVLLYKPQLIADMGSFISKITVLIIVSLIVIKYLITKKRR